MERFEFSDFQSIQSPLQEVEYWKDLREKSTTPWIKEVAGEIHSSLQDAILVFEHLARCNVTKGDFFTSSYTGNDIQHKKNQNQIFSFLEKKFTDGNSIDSSLYRVFQVMDKNGKYVYSALVRSTI